MTTLQRKPTLTSQQVYRLGKFDNAKRWYPRSEVADYFKSIRSPSWAYPYSYLKAAYTQKFYKWLQVHNLLYLVE